MIPVHRWMLCSAACALAIAGAAGTACAQSASGSLSQFSRGYSSSSSALESPVNVSTTDANGNHVITDGVMQTGSDNSVFATMRSGALGSYSGAGSSGTGGISAATAIGNNLSVVVNGSYNTVVVNSTQTNTGTVSATTVLNGKVNLDGSQ